MDIMTPTITKSTISTYGEQVKTRIIYIYNNHDKNKYNYYYVAGTLCCATTVVKNLHDNTPLENILEIIKILRNEQNNNDSVDAQTNILIFTYNYETILQENLIKAGFVKFDHKFNRRRRYDQDIKLIMFAYSF